MDSLFFVTGALICLYFFWGWILIYLGEIIPRGLYDAIVYRHPDSMREFTGPYSGKKARLYVHRKNSPELIEKAREIQHEINVQYYYMRLKRLQKH